MKSFVLCFVRKMIALGICILIPTFVNCQIKRSGINYDSVSVSVTLIVEEEKAISDLILRDSYKESEIEFGFGENKILAREFYGELRNLADTSSIDYYEQAIVIPFQKGIDNFVIKIGASFVSINEEDLKKEIQVSFLSKKKILIKKKMEARADGTCVLVIDI